MPQGMIASLGQTGYTLANGGSISVIHFPCSGCGQRFSLEEDQAGGVIQCPTCHRLNDVPTHDELLQITTDGTYKMDAPPAPNADDVVADLAYIYQRGATDADGNEIDLRLTDEERSKAGNDGPIPLKPEPTPPRYDPETGELISAFEIKKTEEIPNPAAIPMAKPALNYANFSTDAASQPYRLSGLLASLFSPLNLAVIAGVFLAHLLFWPILLVIFAGVLLIVIAAPVMAALILAHYGNVIEDFGPNERDELPRPLRDLGIYEDIWAPFCGVFASLLICYGPSILLVTLIPGIAPAAVGLAILLAGVGTLLFPAILLTLQTSGTSLNLRPDRVWGLIGVCGKDYMHMVLLWILAGGVYGFAWLTIAMAIDSFNHAVNVPAALKSWQLGIAESICGIILMHWFCAGLGMLYRRRHEQFPWILQRHISTREKIGQPAGLPPSRRRRHAGLAIDRDGGKTGRMPAPRSR